MRYLLFIVLANCAHTVDVEQYFGGLGETCEQVRLGPTNKTCDIIVCWKDRQAARLVATNCRDYEPPQQELQAFYCDEGCTEQDWLWMRQFYDRSIYWDGRIEEVVQVTPPAPSDYTNPDASVQSVL